MPFSREAEMLRPVARYLSQERGMRAFAEVAFFEHSIDCVGVSMRGRTVLAVELKLNRWHKALRQALLYQLVADFAYVALPSGVTTRVDSDLFMRTGVGLLGVGSRGLVEEIIPSIKGVALDRGLRRLLLTRLRYEPELMWS